MCGLPSRSLSHQALISGPGGYLVDKVHGRGTMQKFVDRQDKTHMSVFKRLGVKKEFMESFGFMPGTVPGPNKKSGNIDFKAEKAAARFKREEAERDRIWRMQGNSTSRPFDTVLGG